MSVWQPASSGVIERRAKQDHEPVDAWDLDRFAGLAKRRPALAFPAFFLLWLCEHLAYGAGVLAGWAL